MKKIIIIGLFIIGYILLGIVQYMHYIGTLLTCKYKLESYMEMPPEFLSSVYVIIEDYAFFSVINMIVILVLLIIIIRKKYYISNKKDE